MARRQPFDEDVSTVPLASKEPTNDELATGTWPQMQRTTSVVVPEGVFAQLAQARQLYRELTTQEHDAYRVVTDLTVSANEFARKGDMSPETAALLAEAQASKVFTSLEVYVPKPKYVSQLEAAIIGTITTSNGPRYFRVNPPTRGKWDVKQVAKAARSAKSREWWVDSGNAIAVIMLTSAIILLVTPIVLAFIYGTAWMLLWWIPAAIVWGLIAELLDDLL